MLATVLSTDNAPQDDHPLATTVDAISLALAAMAPVALAILWRRGWIGPRALSRPTPRDVSWLPWWFYLFCAGIAVFSGGVAATLSWPFGGDSTPLGEAIARVSASLGATVAAVLLVRLIRSVSPPGISRESLNLRLQPSDVARAAGILALTLPLLTAAGLAASLLMTHLTGTSPPVVAHETLRLLHEQTSPVVAGLHILAAVVLVPVAEEIVFRVFVQSAALRLLKRPWAAVGLTGALFAAVHLGGGIPLDAAHALVPLWVLGVVLGAAYERTRRLAVPVLVHALFNGLNVALVLLYA